MPTQNCAHVDDVPRRRRKIPLHEVVWMRIELRAAMALNGLAYALDKAAAAFRRGAIRLCDGITAKMNMEK